MQQETSQLQVKTDFFSFYPVSIFFFFSNNNVPFIRKLQSVIVINNLYN